MENIGILKISKENPNFASYQKTMNFWNQPSTIEVNESFHAIYLGDMFLAAGITNFDKEGSKATVTLLNGSNTYYDRINKEASKLLTDMIQKENKDIDVFVKCLNRR